ncbi:alanine--tRNA ligase-related protein [Asanoa sp. WMMD1127]|uniref:alanine--tRNA ligase-related protein n=1 Tax=Asanoa sp. WMMD1127 TaxID=3016107 RepID=UPI002417F8B4|nr:alanine--tRNA ligase-related protein [Asanoa sp. WMMD1127]MDG4823137.1 alanine--tRNA ligase-related protein [Asanoa sp. WMMD1127]
MRSDQIRTTFLDYFRGLDHLELPPGPLVTDERDLLFTNAGMVQFKPYFIGRSRPPHARLMTAQRCVRTVDIDRIGLTDRHATGFEMLGNFAFGDYFKRESMVWALELLTDGFGLDRDRLWMTVLRGDEESVDLWRSLGVPESRIQRLGPDDNFWSMDMPGPSGPTSEIFWDRGPAVGRDGGPAVDSERFVELWNLVFMQYLRGDSDEEILGDLPGRHIDTGLGRDRLAMVLQGVDNLQETDLVRPTLEAVRDATGRDDEPAGHRLVTDHVRTAVFLISAGVRPGNEGRGYVVRRLLRRAVRRLVLLGVDEPVLGPIADSVTEVPPGGAGRSVVEREEQAFRRTLRAGSRLLDTELRQGPLRGETVFKLHDTYGFPVDLTVEIARESGVAVDTEGFARLMREHRERSRAGRP